jgi:hypothetical protein
VLGIGLCSFRRKIDGARRQAAPASSGSFLSFSVTFHIELLWAKALWKRVFLSHSVMTYARQEFGHLCLHAVPKPKAGRESATSKDRISDVWPDWSAEIAEAELSKVVEKNRPAIVLWDAVRTIVISVSMVVLLMAILGVLHVR